MLNVLLLVGSLVPLAAMLVALFAAARLRQGRTGARVPARQRRGR